MKQATIRRLLDALGSARQIREESQGASFDQFRQDTLRLLGFVKQFEIIGEALNRARKGEPSIEGMVPRLRRYINLRNQLVHEYDKIDYHLVWQTAVEGVPDLVSALESVIGSLGQALRSDNRTPHATDQPQAPPNPARRPARQR